MALVWLVNSGAFPSFKSLYQAFPNSAFSLDKEGLDHRGRELIVRPAMAVETPTPWPSSPPGSDGEHPERGWKQTHWIPEGLTQPPGLSG